MSQRENAVTVSQSEFDQQTEPSHAVAVVVFIVVVFMGAVVLFSQSNRLS